MVERDEKALQKQFGQLERMNEERLKKRMYVLEVYKIQGTRRIWKWKKGLKNMLQA